MGQDCLQPAGKIPKPGCQGSRSSREPREVQGKGDNGEGEPDSASRVWCAAVAGPGVQGWDMKKRFRKKHRGTGAEGVRESLESPGARRAAGKGKKKGKG